MSNVKFAPWPVFDQEIQDAVKAVLASGKTNQWVGEHVYAFEKEYAKSLGVKHAIAMANGSVALDTALKVLGIGPGDEVVVTSRSFVASASCVALAGALPVFADVDPVSGNITAETIKAVLTPKTRVVIVVHLAGWPCDMDPILALCRAKKLFLIEDCAQAHGARYKSKPVGTFGHFGAFSFCQDKIMTTGGEGGLLVTNNAVFYQKAWSFKDHGRDLAAVLNRKDTQGFKWMVKSFGTNYRMTEMQAAIGRIMLQRLDAMVDKRRMLASRFDQAFGRMPGLLVVRPSEKFYHSYYKYYVYVDPKPLKAAWSRDKILQALSSLGIPCGSGACPEIYREKAFVDQGKKLRCAEQKRWPVARWLGETSLMLQVHPTLSVQSIHCVIDAMKSVMTKATK